VAETPTTQRATLPSPLAAPAGRARPVWLYQDEPDHLTADGEVTLCGETVHSNAYPPVTFNIRRACRECRRVAKERGLAIDRP